MNSHFQSDKLLLVLIFLILCLLITHFSHDPHDVKALDWAIQTGSLVAGALLALLTNRAMARKADEHNQVQDPPSVHPTAAPQDTTQPPK